MRHTPQSSNTTTGDILLYGMVVGFTVLFWVATIVIWAWWSNLFRVTERPGFILTLFGLPFPFFGYYLMTHGGHVKVSPFVYSAVQVILLVAWVVVSWFWFQAHYWEAAVAWWTYGLVALFMFLPYWVLSRMSWFSTIAENITPTLATPVASPIANNPITVVTDGVDDWLSWLGNGESHRGAMVVLIFVFWSLLFWTWPGIKFEIITFSSWGLITILGLFVLRAIFKPVPGPGVPGAGSPKSPGK